MNAGRPLLARCVSTSCFCAILRPHWDAPTHCAARARNVGAFQALLLAKPNLDLADGNGFTPALAWLGDFGAMHTWDGGRAATVDERWAMVEACLAAGANPNLCTRNKDSLLTFALTDSPERVQWAFDQGCASFNPREDLEDTFFSSFRYLEEPKGHHKVRDDGLAYARSQENATYRWDRAGILALLESREGYTHVGRNDKVRTFFEEGFERDRLEPSDVAYLVGRGRQLNEVDAEGNTLTHRLFTQRSYSNARGRALYEAFQTAGLPDQWDCVNHAGETPVEARSKKIPNWSVQEAQALDILLPTPLILPIPSLLRPQADRDHPRNIRLGK